MTTNKHYDNYYHFRAKTIFNCAKVQCLEHLKLKLACVHEQYGAILHKKALPWALITALCVKAWVREDQGTGLVFSPNTNVWGFFTRKHGPSHVHGYDFHVGIFNIFLFLFSLLFK